MPTATATTQTPALPRTLQRTLRLLFLLSGATALIYQVVWTRLLTLFFGSTTLAVSTVLAVFMGGLALGSALLGRRADRARQPVRFYGWLELGIGLLAIATPLTFAAIGDLYVMIRGAAEMDFWSAALLRFALSGLLLLPPTVLMGGTLPVLAKVFLRSRDADTARSISALYFINTLGAVLGTLAAGLFLLQLMGIQALLIAAGLVNVGIFLWTRRLAPPVAVVAAAADDAAAAPPPWSPAARFAVLILFCSGLAALIYEVVWTRVLTLVIGSSTYAFTLMLATFLIGIALGSALVGRYARRRRPGLGLLALCQALIGALALGTALLFGLLPDAFVALFGAVGENYNLFLLANFLLCFTIMVPATLFMGASFPIASALVVEHFGSSGARLGLLYAGNTVGAILGAFLAGFVLLPQLGIQRTLVLTIALNLASALALSFYVWRQAPRSRRWFTPALAGGLLLLLVFWQPPWDRLRMTSGPYAYAIQYQQLPIDARNARLEQLFYREGPMATVSVIREGQHRRLVVEGKTDAGNFRDMPTQVLLGHLPLLFQPAARDVLIVGYASGITAGAAGRHPLERIDCVEIEPAMRAASDFFAAENYRIGSDPRFHLVVDDARAFVLGAGRRYDAIISEPSNPWQAGSSRLFTREALHNAHQRLKPGGVMVQWMHLYGVDADSLRLVARTFLAEFRHVSLWADPEYPDVFFLGSDELLGVDPVEFDRLFATQPAVAASLARIGYPDAASLFRAFLLDDAAVRRFAGSGPLNTDNLPLLEFRAPRSLYTRNALQDNVRALLQHRPREAFPELAFTAPEHAAPAAALLRQWAGQLAQRGAVANASGALARAVTLQPQDAQTQAQLGRLRLDGGDLDGARQAFEAAVAADPRLGLAHAHLGALYLQAGDPQRAQASLLLALAHGAESAELRNNLAVTYAESGRMADALREAKRALALDPTHSVARNNAAIFEKRLEQR